MCVARPCGAVFASDVACYSPLAAWRTESGEVVFQDRGDRLDLPCGRCIGCRLERSRQWAVRICHEAALHESSFFLTLTYRDAPPSLDYRDFRLFLRRLRRARRGSKIRFFMCGEYGEQFSRAHFHAVVFGVDFPDKILYSDGADRTLWSSGELDRLWSHGFCTLGSVSFESARYVASYVLKRVNGQLSAAHYECVDPSTGEILQRAPEFCQMSRRPGIGHDWLRLFWQDVYPSGSVVVNGREGKAPRYYDRVAAKLVSFEEAVAKRAALARAHAHDNTDERLRVRERVAMSRGKVKRSYECK